MMSVKNRSVWSLCDVCGVSRVWVVFVVMC